MTADRRRDLLALLVLVVLTLPALWPLLGPGLVQSNDVASHLYRVVCLDEGFARNDQLKANAVQIFRTKGVTSFKTV